MTKVLARHSLHTLCKACYGCYILMLRTLHVTSVTSKLAKLSNNIIIKLIWISNKFTLLMLTINKWSKYSEFQKWTENKSSQDANWKKLNLFLHYWLVMMHDNNKPKTKLCCMHYYYYIIDVILFNCGYLELILTLKRQTLTLAHIVNIRLIEI